MKPRGRRFSYNYKQCCYFCFVRDEDGTNDHAAIFMRGIMSNYEMCHPKRLPTSPFGGCCVNPFNPMHSFAGRQLVTAWFNLVNSVGMWQLPRLSACQRGCSRAPVSPVQQELLPQYAVELHLG